jgi:hypothetical protein
VCALSLSKRSYPMCAELSKRAHLQQAHGPMFELMINYCLINLPEPLTSWVTRVGSPE